MHYKFISKLFETKQLIYYLTILYIVVDAGLGLGAYFEFGSENYIVAIPLYPIKKFIAVLLVNS